MEIKQESIGDKNDNLFYSTQLLLLLRQMERDFDVSIHFIGSSCYRFTYI